MSSSSSSSQPSEQQLLRLNHPVSLQKDHIDKFLEDYDPKRFDELAHTVVERFKAHAPTDSFGESIKYQITSRGKDRDILRKNIRKAENVETPEKLLLASCLRDLAGVRILTYFPDDVPAVAEHITTQFDLVSKPIVQHAKRSTWDPNSPNKESAEDGESAKLVSRNYPKGMWRQTNAEDVVRDWKHSGYRAVHFYVNGSDAKKPEHDLSTDPIPGLWMKTVEIQITTIVMHAWSEVEHDLIYKNPYQLPPDPTIDRMVDAVNGLAITNEILLQQLQQTFQSSRQTEEEVFEDLNVLKAWIFQHYLGVGPEDKYSSLKRRSFVHVVVDLLCGPVFQIEALTRRKVKTMIQERAESSPDQIKSTQTPKQVHWEQQDGFHLLRKLLQNEHDSIQADLSNQSSDIQRLHKFLLASSMYSIWYGISSWSFFFIKGTSTPPASSRCEQNSPERVFSRINEINEILVGKSLYSSIPLNILEELEAFCEEFLSCTCCEEHEVATKLAKLSLFLYTNQHEVYREDLPRMFEDWDRSESVLSILYKRTDEEERQVRQQLEKEGCMIIPATPIDFRFLREEINEYVLEERHRADIPRFNFEFDFESVELSRREGMVIPLAHRLGSPGSVSWWRENPWFSELNGLEFDVNSEETSIAELCWIEPANVYTYLGCILEGKRARLKSRVVGSLNWQPT